MCVTANAADQWDKLEILGTRQAADIDAYIDVNNEALDRLNIGYRSRCSVVPTNSANTVVVLAGEIAIPNAAGSIVRWRRNTSSTTVAWTDANAATEVVSTQYYIWAIADADLTTFTVEIATSATTPTGTYRKLIGSFYNDASGNITDVCTIYSGVTMKLDSTADTVNDTSYGTDMTGTSIKYYASGKPVVILFSAEITGTNGVVKAIVDIDGSDKSPSERAYHVDSDIGSKVMDLVHAETLTTGIHTITIQGKVTSSSCVVDDKTLVIMEV